MSKAEQLVQDIAKLFVKYSLDDWQLVLDMLRRGGPEHVEIAAAIEQLAKQRPSKGNSVKQSDDRLVRLLADVNGARATVLRELFSNLKSRKLAPKLADLRDAYIRTGGKNKLPPRRDDAIYILLEHMARMKDDVLVSSVQDLSERNMDLKNDYSRWFNIIYSKSE